MMRRAILGLAGCAIAVSCLGCPGLRAIPSGNPAPAPPGPIHFEEVAEASGVRFRWSLNPQRPLRILDTYGCGCAFLDFNADGHQDIFLVGEPRCALFLNQGDGTFRDVSEESGLNTHRALWKGCAIGDYDGDAYPDILITAYRGLRLLRNEGGRRVTDVTSRAGLPPDNLQQWGSSAGFMDLDGDGDLELIVGSYVVFNPSTPQLCELVKGVKSGCTPQSYQAEFARLYRNDGGRFRDVSQASGINTAHGKVLALSFCDYDKDGRTDFYMANDGTPADLMLNLGNLRFRNEGTRTGTAYGGIPGQPIAAMGVDWADYNRDGWLDFAVSAFENEAYSLHRNEGDGFFRNAAQEMGLVEPTFRPLGFGTTFLDADNDGFPDLFFANGHVYDNADEVYPGSTFPQRMMLFHNQGGRRFTDVAPTLGPPWARPVLGRGSARGDYDGDGRVDLLVVDYSGAPLLLRNRSGSPGHWLTLGARGKRGNRLGYGLRAEGRVGGQVWVGEIAPSVSYLSTSAPEIHFGLGTVARLDEVRLTWPSGKTATLSNVQGDRRITVVEPD